MTSSDPSPPSSLGLAFLHLARAHAHAMNIKAAGGPSTAELRAEIAEMWVSLAGRCDPAEMDGYQHAGEAVHAEVIGDSQGVMYEKILLITRLNEAQAFLDDPRLGNCGEERDHMRNLQDQLTDWMNDPPPPEVEAPVEVQGEVASTTERVAGHASGGIARRPGGRESRWGVPRAVRRPGGRSRP